MHGFSEPNNVSLEYITMKAVLRAGKVVGSEITIIITTRPVMRLEILRGRLEKQMLDYTQQIMWKLEEFSCRPRNTLQEL